MDKKEYRVKIKIGDAEVEVEGAESGVVKIVSALSDVLRTSRKPATTASPGSPLSTPSSVPTSRPSQTDIRSFFEEKKPSSDVEAAAVATYYFQYLAPERERREAIDSALLLEAFRQARRPLPAKTIYTLQNARGAGYLDSAGEGQFRLNPVGYNLVEHNLGGENSESKVRRSKPGRKPTKNA